MPRSSAISRGFGGQVLIGAESDRGRPDSTLLRRGRRLRKDPGHAGRRWAAGMICDFVHVVMLRCKRI